MTLIAIILLILLGVGLIVVEVIFVPGTTLVGILGLGIAALGLFFGFIEAGFAIGMWLLIGASVVTVGAIVYSLRSNTWNRLSLKNQIDSKVNEEDKLVAVGDLGKALSELRPFGKAEFGSLVLEVRTDGYHVTAGTDLRVTQVIDRTVYVEPLTNYS